MVLWEVPCYGTMDSTWTSRTQPPPAQQAEQAEGWAAVGLAPRPGSPGRGLPGGEKACLPGQASAR